MRDSYYDDETILDEDSVRRAHKRYVRWIAREFFDGWFGAEITFDEFRAAVAKEVTE